MSRTVENKVSWQDVKSSNLKMIGFASSCEPGKVVKTMDVYVKFIADDAVWKYSKVPVDVCLGFASAPSHGSYYAKNIKGKFEGERL